MPVSFLTAEQRESYGRFAAVPTPEEIARYFHISDTDLALIAKLRGDHNRLGFALQLTTVRFLGVFLENPTTIPAEVLQKLLGQLQIGSAACLDQYQEARQHRKHAAEIRTQYGFVEFSDPIAGFRLTRWLYALCWTGTERPSVLFERATTWLLTHKVLLPGASTLERFIAKLRSRVETRLWCMLGRGITAAQRTQLENLLVIPAGSRVSLLDRLRSGPFRISSRALTRAIERLESIRELGIALPHAAQIPPSRIASLARFATTAKVTALLRLPAARRIAILVAFAHSMEATAHDDALALLEIVLHDLFGGAKNADKNTRLRTLKDLDRAATHLADACRLILDSKLADEKLRATIFQQIPRSVLAQALEQVRNLVRPPDDVCYRELHDSYRSVRSFLPALVKHIRFGANPAGTPVVAAIEWPRQNERTNSATTVAPRDVITKGWKQYVLQDDGELHHRAYTFCVLDQLRSALRRRDVFVSPSWRYADPRAGLVTGNEWENLRPFICRTLDSLPTPNPHSRR